MQNHQLTSPHHYLVVIAPCWFCPCCSLHRRHDEVAVLKEVLHPHGEDFALGAQPQPLFQLLPLESQPLLGTCANWPLHVQRTKWELLGESFSGNLGHSPDSGIPLPWRRGVVSHEGGPKQCGVLYLECKTHEHIILHLFDVK